MNVHSAILYVGPLCVLSYFRILRNFPRPERESMEKRHIFPMWICLGVVGRRSTISQYSTKLRFGDDRQQVVMKHFGFARLEMFVWGKKAILFKDRIASANQAFCWLYFFIFRQYTHKYIQTNKMSHKGHNNIPFHFIAKYSNERKYLWVTGNNVTSWQTANKSCKCVVCL